MSRFILFRGNHFYPSGGWEDVFGMFDTIEAAETSGRRYADEGKTVGVWWHVVDIELGTIVIKGESAEVIK